MPAGRPEAPVVLGRVSGLFGVMGWVKVYSYTDPRDAIVAHREWLLKSGTGWKPARVLEGKKHGKSVIACLEGVGDRDAAAALVDCDIAVAREQLPAPEHGHYYWCDLEGLRVIDQDGAEIGTVGYVLETGAHDVLVVEGERERLIPFVVGDTILDVDVEGGIIKIDWEWD